MGRYKKDVGDIIRIARNHGFTCEGMTGSGHWRLRHTCGQMMIVSATPSGGGRWRQNVLNTMHKINNQHTKDTK